MVEYVMRRTKIICTVGPACDKPGVLKKMISAGMNVARFNLSHGSYPEHVKRMNAIRRLSKKVSILADLQGPRIRTGYLKDKKIYLYTGQTICLTHKKVLGHENLISFSPGSVFADIKVGHPILIADGTIRLKVKAKKKAQLECLILDGGPLGERKGINVPKTTLSLPPLTAKDKKDVAWAIKQKVDYFALSFVRSPDDIVKLKKLINKLGASIPVIAKIERPEAVACLCEIVQVSDAVMVARGDLGIEINLEKVPAIQRDIIQLCRILKKPVIVATQMLESMVNEETPTRAEVSDVANAIYDGAGLVMLSEETSIGKYPVEAVKTMARIVDEAERDRLSL